MKIMAVNQGIGSMSNKSLPLMGEKPSDYSGNISPQTAWDTLKTTENAWLIDVRTQAEWAFVGQVNIASLNKTPLYIEWQSFPNGQQNTEFLTQCENHIDNKTAYIFFLCRSGARSTAAARYVHKHGYQYVYNIDGGFEGDHDAQAHRGKINGWKASELLWQQN